MGTSKSRAEKTAWMDANMKKFKHEEVLIRNFCKKFKATTRYAKELMKMLR